MSLSNNFPVNSSNLNLSLANAGRLDPRVTFTRASTGTFYDGYSSAKAEENLLLQSQALTTSPWTVTSLNAVGSKTAPDGTATAIEITATGTNGRTRQTVTVVSGQTYTHSMFVRRVTGSGNVTLAILDSGGTALFSTVMSLTSDWQRFTVSGAPAVTSIQAGIIIATSTDAVEVWGAQLEQRSSVTSYTATTTAPITNYIPVLQTAAADVPRFDHNPTTRAALGLLVEEQRANICLQSEDFATTWTLAASSITSNTIVAPNGTLTGDALIESATNSTHNAQQSISFTSGTAYTLSCYAKLKDTRSLRLGLPSAAFGSTVYAIWNLSTGALTTTSGSPTTTSITPVGNGWYRCSVTASATSTTSASPFVSVTNGSTISYAGDDYSGVFIWGAQVEAGAFPTSYIATTTASVTRNADSVNMTGGNFGWYNATEGTVYAEAATNGTASTGGIFRLVNIADTTRRMRLSYASGTTLNFAVTDSTTQVSLNLVTGLTVGSFNKGAVAYKIDDFAGSANGLTALTDTVGTVPAGIDQIVIGQDGAAASTILNGTIRTIRYYPVRNSDAQLQALTG